MKAFAWYDVTFGLGILILTVGLSLWSIPLGTSVFGLLLCTVGARGAVMANRTHAAVSPAPAIADTDPHIEDAHGNVDQAA